MIDHRLVHRHFKTADPVLAGVVKQVGPVTFKPQRDRFKLLVRSIISQQISTAAARTIRGRLEESLGRGGVCPATVASLSIEELRQVGVSHQKAGYIIDLAQKCSAGAVRLSRLGRMDDEAVIEELTQVRGIGRWSAQMFLIFSLGRLDVFPHDDLGVRMAIRRLYRFEQMPNKEELLEIGGRWRPYASLGSWYCWRYLELKPKP
jgi:DNA-3-methyladenine glycosylase II